MHLLTLALTAHAADIYVGPGLEHTTVAEAVAAASPGDTLLLLPGTYQVESVVLDQNLSIEGLGGWAVTTLQVTGFDTGLDIDGANVHLSHLTFQMNGSNRGVYADYGAETELEHVRFSGGGGSPGGCAWIVGDSVMRDVHFDGCEAGLGSGGGLFYEGQELALDSATFTDNEARTGAGLRCAGRCEVRRSVFQDNTSFSGGGAIALSGHLDLKTSRLCGNDAGSGGGFWINNGTVDMETSVIWDNTATNGGALFVVDEAGAIVRSRHNIWGYNTGGSAVLSSDDNDMTFNNEIVVHHPQIFAAERVASDSTWNFDTYIDHNNLSGFLGATDSGQPATRTGGIFADPMLANNSRTACAPADFILGAGSPAIDAATSTDADGSPGDLGPFGSPDPWQDVDNDGIFAPEDCNDDDASIHPGATESCNGQDDNCDGIIDGGTLTLTDYWPDADGDGVGAGSPVALCAPAPGMVPLGGDCDDGDNTVGPNAIELCDGLDQDCDGVVDNGLTQSNFYPDNDGDGYGDGTPIQACAAPSGYAARSGDCDDTDHRYNPGVVEDDCADPADYNCDGSTGFADNDSDGFAACEECNDSDSAVNPRASEICDGIDNNCDGGVDTNAVDAVELAEDADRDGFGNPAIVDDQCPGTSGWVDDRSDCDDTNPAINPSRDDIVDNGVDEDCDGQDLSSAPGGEPLERSGCTTLSASPGWLVLFLPLAVLRRRKI